MSNQTTQGLVKLPYGFCQTLAKQLEADTHELCLKDAGAQHKLCQLLGVDGYTHLVLSDGVCHEIVKIVCPDGKTLCLDREQEGTSALRWQACSKVTFEMTPGITLAALMESKALDECVDDDIPDDDSPECEAVEFCIPGYVIKFEDGCLTKEEDCDTKIPDGAYTNPTLCFKDNKLVRVDSTRMHMTYEGSGCACSSSIECNCDKAETVDGG